jgi:hypothetical protein
MMAVFALLLVLGIPQLLSVRAMMAMQTRWSDSRVDVSPIRISMDPIRKRPKTVVTGGGPRRTMQIEIPLQVAGLGQGMDLFADDVTIEIEGPDGKVSRAAGGIVQQSDGFWQRMYVDLPIFQQLKEAEVTLRSSVYLTFLGDQKTTQIKPQESATEVPGLGMCHLSQDADNFSLACFSPFRRSRLFAKTFLFSHMDVGEPYIEPGSYSPYPAEAGINPLVVSVRGNGSFSGNAAEPMTATIVTEAPLAHCRQDFEIRGLRLGDYAIK